MLVAVASACDSSNGRSDVSAARPPLWKRDPNEPYPFTTPIPRLTPTAIDGVYAREITVEAAGGKPVPCRRCAPYRIYAGKTTLEFDEGRFRVSHDAVGDASSSDFKSKGHFELAGDTITLFNDAYCPDTRGVYSWQLTEGRLVFGVVEDDCPYADLRARYLTAFPWNTTG